MWRDGVSTFEAQTTGDNLDGIHIKVNQRISCYIDGFRGGYLRLRKGFVCNSLGTCRTLRIFLTHYSSDKVSRKLEILSKAPTYLEPLPSSRNITEL